jgi:hypothetical protein
MIERSRKEKVQMSDDPTTMNDEGAWESSEPKGSRKASKHDGSTINDSKQDRRTAMNQTSIIKQAWSTLIHYRALWVFGVILALTAASVGSVLTWLPDDEPDYARRGITIQPRDGETFWDAVERTFGAEIDRANHELDELFEELNLRIKSDIVAYLITLAAIAVALYLIRLVGRYLSRTALIRMVDQYQETGQKLGVRKGFRLGWSRQTWQLFFIELLVNLVVLAAILLIFALIFGPLPLWVDGSEGTIFALSILTAGFFFLAIFVVIVGCVFASIVKRFARRACVLEGLGVTASVVRGYGLARQNLKDLLPLVMVMIGIDLSWPFVAGVLMLLLFGTGMLVGGLPGLLTGNVLTLLATGATPVVVGAVVGGVILLLILVAPLVWLDGMRYVFLSSMWTVTYRQIQGWETAPQDHSPERPALEPPPLAQGASGLAG